MPKFDSKRSSWAVLDPTMLVDDDDDDDVDNDTSASYSQDELNLSGPESRRRTSWANIEDIMMMATTSQSGPSDSDLRGLDSISENGGMSSQASLRTSTTSTNTNDSSMSNSNQSHRSSSSTTTTSTRSLGKAKKAELKRRMAKNRNGNSTSTLMKSPPSELN